GERAEIVEVAGTGTYLENLTRFKQLFKEDKVTELFAELKKTMAFPKMGKTRVRNVTDLETEYRVRYNIKAEDPIPNYPYSRNNPVTDFELEETGYFVRVYDDKPTSYWIFRIEDLRAYKNMDEVAENLALPNKPTKIGLVEIPEGTVLRKSVAGPQPWGTKPQGGGIQYEIIETPKVEWFKPLFKNDIEVEQFFK
ncbi:MAG: hypothetical protein LBN93_07100, partial [Candidatus Symbiothrix sp.]|nr:hypothetical protein [Candidatus Symbiothrix sp.]